MTIEAEREPAPHITFIIDDFDEKTRDVPPPPPPSFRLMTLMYSGYLDLALDNTEKANRETWQEQHSRALHLLDDRLVGVAFYDPGLGVDLTDLPLGSDHPTKSQLEAFFTENDIYLGRKTEEQIRVEFEQRAGRWISNARETGEPDPDHPDYIRLTQIGPAIVPLALERWRRNPNEPWRWAISSLAYTIASVDSVGDDWDILGKKPTLSDEQARERYINWGRQNGLIGPQFREQANE